MRRRFKPVLGAAGAFIVGELVRRKFGMTGALVWLVLLLLAWVLIYIWAERAMDRLYLKFQSLNDNGKDQALGQLDPEIRKEIEKRIAKAKGC